MNERSGLVDRHVAFLRALREAGLPVSLAEGLDTVAALRALPWDDRATVREAYAATLVKRHAQRPTFDALFDVYFPRLVGEGAPEQPAGQPAGQPEDLGTTGQDSPEALARFRDRLLAALEAG